VVSKTSWIVLFLGVALSPGCVSAAKYMSLQDELARTQDELAYTQESLAKAEDLLTTAELDRDELEKLRQQLVAAENARQDLQAKLDKFQQANSLLAAEGWEGVVNTAEGTYGYRAHGDVLFASGSSTLSSTGKAALDALVSTLKSDPNPIRIDGHTDADPVVKTKDLYKAGNIELGAQRAIAVRQYLIDKGIEPGRIAIASYGEYKPVASGKSAEAKAQNRRVEVLMQAPRNNRG
jgi:chemotaxis protein MotB